MRIPTKTIDLAVVSVLYLFFVIPPVVFSFLSPLVLTLCWFLLPSLYLVVRRKKNLKKIALATLFIGLLALSMDIFLIHNYAWESYKLTFLFQIFGAPIEEVAWFFSHIFYIIVWYEHFLDDESIHRISPHFPLLITFAIAVFTFVLVAVSLFPDVSRIRYAYLTIGGLGMTPIIIYLFTRRVALLKKFMPLVVFFFLFALFMEIRAVQFGLWSFHDIHNYLAVVTFFGATFPIEEIIFWMTLAPNVALAYYELFADDGS